MIVFTSEEIIYSVICAIVFGILFSAVIFVFQNFFNIICIILSSLLRTDKKIKEKLNNTVIRKISDWLIIIKRIGKALFSNFKTVLTVFLFTIGFILLSYYTLDGVVRLYQLIIAFFAYKVTMALIFNPINKITTSVVVKISDCIYSILNYIIKIISWPFKFLYLNFKKRKENKRKVSD